jgi:hypothetical protein
MLFNRSEGAMATGTFFPRDYIGALVAGERPARKFLGTAFYVAADGLLMTAGHVLDGWDGAEPLVVALGLQPDKRADVRRVEFVARHGSLDLALLRTPDHPKAVWMTVRGRPVSHNFSVMTYEYSATVASEAGVHVVPATRIGNITREIDMSAWRGGDDALELSFPALRGASGAPLLLNQQGSEDVGVCGVLISNVSHHLLPVHIETVLDKRNEILEETKFLLPQGVAINGRHIVEFLRATGAKYVEK